MAEHFAEAMFTDKPITGAHWESARKGKHEKRWGSPTIRAINWYDAQLKESGTFKIVPYAEFPSLERVSLGLALIYTTQQELKDIKVKKGERKVLDSIELREVPYSEPFVRYTEAYDLEGDEGSYVFEEEPFVNVGGKKDWKKLKESHDSAYGSYRKKQGWDPVAAEYEGPGLYDARDMSRQYKSVEEYELSAMETQADEMIDYIFSGGLMGSDLRGNEWVEAFETLAKRAAVDMAILTQEEVDEEV